MEFASFDDYTTKVIFAVTVGLVLFILLITGAAFTDIYYGQLNSSNRDDAIFNSSLTALIVLWTLFAIFGAISIVVGVLIYYGFVPNLLP